MTEILAAKRDTVAALERALAAQVDENEITTAEGALAFIRTWRAALDDLVPPAPADPLPYDLRDADDLEAIHHHAHESYTMTACGQDIVSEGISYTPVRQDVTCRSCRTGMI